MKAVTRAAMAHRRVDFQLSAGLQVQEFSNHLLTHLVNDV